MAVIHSSPTAKRNSTNQLSELIQTIGRRSVWSPALVWGQRAINNWSFVRPQTWKPIVPIFHVLFAFAKCMTEKIYTILIVNFHNRVSGFQLSKRTTYPNPIWPNAFTFRVLKLSFREFMTMVSLPVHKSI